MQATGVLLLFCTSAYWLLTETFPTTTMKYKDINTLINEILKLTFPKVNKNVSLPFNYDEKCFQKNLEIFMNATQTIPREDRNVSMAIYSNLRKIQAYRLPGCNSEDCDCQKVLIHSENFEGMLKSFLHQIQCYISKGNCS